MRAIGSAMGALDPQCPSGPVNMIELEDEVQEFEPNQDRRNATSSVSEG